MGTDEQAEVCIIRKTGAGGLCQVYMDEASANRVSGGTQSKEL